MADQHNINTGGSKSPVYVDKMVRDYGTKRIVRAPQPQPKPEIKPGR